CTRAATARAPRGRSPRPAARRGTSCRCPPVRSQAAPPRRHSPSKKGYLLYHLFARPVNGPAACKKGDASHPPLGWARSLAQHAQRLLAHVLRREAELLEQQLRRRGGAVVIQADHRAVQAHILVP